ncbi:MAG: hypothetical protein RLZZ223_143 [Candidatus Parcubacteria bacterium]|jgi:hypothetical protein
MNFEGYRPNNSKEIEEVELESVKTDDSLAEDIPPQYRGLDAETLYFIWTIPEYIDKSKTERLKAQKNRVLERLRKEEAENQNEIKTEGEKKLYGWTASYELARIAKSQSIDLSTLSREEYVDFAIQNKLMIDDTQLRMAPWQRMCESAEEVIEGNRMKAAIIKPEIDQAFDEFTFEMMEKSKEEDRYLDTNIRVRQGTKVSNSWLFFGINQGVTENDSRNETFKSYISLKDLNKLTPERFKTFMTRLRNAGYNGDIKIFQDLTSQGINLNDQIVMHGASEADAILGLRVAEYFLGRI